MLVKYHCINNMEYLPNVLLISFRRQRSNDFVFFNVLKFLQFVIKSNIIFHMQLFSIVKKLVLNYKNFVM